MGTTAIGVRDLVKRYPKSSTNAVDGVSFDVARGEIFGLLGPNGAGKTTIIGALTTFILPTSGSTSIMGFDTAKQPIEVKKRIAVVPQQSNLDRSLKVREILTFHAAYHGVPRKERIARADAILDELGLGDRKDEKVNRYSGGMAQRLMIARALMHSPDVLFLDEPTNNLDPQSRLFLWERIRARVPSASSRFAMSAAPGAASLDVHLKPAEWMLLCYLHGSRSVRELTELTGYNDFETAKVLYGMYAAGLIERVGPAGEPLAD